MRWAALLLLLSASGCWVTTSRGQQMEARIQRLEGESALATKQLDEQRALLRERIAAADRKIAEVQKKLDELNSAARGTSAGIRADLDRLQDDARGLQGTLETVQHELAQLRQEAERQKGDTETALGALKSTGALSEYETRKRLETLERPDDKEAFFALAQEREAAGERGVARELYLEFTRKWPKDPQAADAHFRVGELLFAERKYPQAILEYGKVAQEFPRSDKAPDALFRMAESSAARDQREDARALWQEVVKRYPKSAAAQRARARLGETSPPRKKTTN